MEVVIVATKKNEEGVGVEKVMVRGVLFLSYSTGRATTSNSTASFAW